MLSLSKIALFSLISFAALALAIPAPEPRQSNAKTLLTNANSQIVQTMYPVGSSAYLSFSVMLLYAYGLRIGCVDSNNATAASVGPILEVVAGIVGDLVSDLQGASLSDCTKQDILGLVATLLKVLFPFPSVVFPLMSLVAQNILDPLGVACGQNSGLLTLVGELVSVNSCTAASENVSEYLSPLTNTAPQSLTSLTWSFGSSVGSSQSY